jgi:hypothetical protein
MTQNLSFKDLRVAIVPWPALGDSAMCLRLAWIFKHAGAQVSFYSNLFLSAREYFPWLNVEPLAKIRLSRDIHTEHPMWISSFAGGAVCLVNNLNLQNLSRQFDLVLCTVVWLPSDDSLRDCLRLDNIAYIGYLGMPKNIPDPSSRNIYVKGHLYSGANRALCLDPQAGLSIVQWMDRYVHEVFGLDCLEPVSVCKERRGEGKNKVTIFPTSSRQEKNYSPMGWLWLAKHLKKNGWMVDFVCLPKERVAIKKTYKDFRVYSFPTIKNLMDYLLDCAAVIGNDSGDGHLASLLGIRTFTITFKKKSDSNFIFYPGFGQNCILAPLIRFRLLGRFIWRPFIPIWRIPIILGKAPD